MSVDQAEGAEHPGPDDADPAAQHAADPRRDRGEHAGGRELAAAADHAADRRAAAALPHEAGDGERRRGRSLRSSSAIGCRTPARRPGRSPSCTPPCSSRSSARPSCSRCRSTGTTTLLVLHHWTLPSFAGRRLRAGDEVDRLSSARRRAAVRQPAGAGPAAGETAPLSGGFKGAARQRRLLPDAGGARSGGQRDLSQSAASVHAAAAQPRVRDRGGARTSSRPPIRARRSTSRMPRRSSSAGCSR